ncbi:MAG TPA: hypothetical protein VKC63_05275 [Solirubrobacterales bacterium]|nr:hypothetical protein [Solirubrobacterales bacterium]
MAPIAFTTQMLLPADPNVYSYVVLAIVVASQLPRWGRSVLAFLRDLDDYRANRPQRKS